MKKIFTKKYKGNKKGNQNYKFELNYHELIMASTLLFSLSLIRNLVFLTSIVRIYGVFVFTYVNYFSPLCEPTCSSIFYLHITSFCLLINLSKPRRFYRCKAYKENNVITCKQMVCGCSKQKVNKVQCV